MANQYRYNSYRGRTPKWKILLAVLLVLVILAAAGVIVLQNNLIYDGSGKPRLRQNASTQSGDEVTITDVDLTIQPPEEEPEAPYGRAVQIAAKPLTAEDPDRSDGYDRTAVVLKDAGGRIYFDVTGAVGGSVNCPAEADAALKALTAQDGVVIGRISCFLDPRAANADVEGMGLKNTGGYIFYDGNNANWIDPGKSGGRAYVISLAKQAAELGCGEILLEHFGYPSEGKLNKIDYGAALTSSRSQQLELFLQELREALPEGVEISVELDAETIRLGDNAVTGQSLPAIAPLVDHVYARASSAEYEELSELVADAAEGCTFVAELQTVPSGIGRNYLLLP